MCDINCLIEYLLKEGFRNDHMCSCIYMKRSKNDFFIIIVCNIANRYYLIKYLKI